MAIVSRKCQGVLAPLALSLLLATPASAAELYGLVIGVDDYVGTSNDLDGAVNDANDVAQALQKLGAREVVRLVNGDATKDRIASSWEELLGKAHAGDTIVFSYAGHGSQEPEQPGRHDEADELNENFLLGGYQSRGARHARAHRRRRAARMDEAGRHQGRACGAGCRSPATPAAWSAARPRRPLKFRKGNFPAITDDRLTPAPEEFAKLSETDFNTITFVGAVAEDRLAPEEEVHRWTQEQPGALQAGALSRARSRRRGRRRTATAR